MLQVRLVAAAAAAAAYEGRVWPGHLASDCAAGTAQLSPLPCVAGRRCTCSRPASRRAHGQHVTAERLPSMPSMLPQPHYPTPTRPSQGLLRRCLDREPSRRPTFDALLLELTREYHALRRQALKEQRAQTAVLLPGGAPQAAAAPPPAAQAAAAPAAAAPAAEEEGTANPLVAPTERLTRRHRAQVE